MPPSAEEPMGAACGFRIMGGETVWTWNGREVSQADFVRHAASELSALRSALEERTRERDLARDDLTQVRLALDDAGASSSAPEHHADKVAEVAYERDEAYATIALALDALFPGRLPDDSYEDTEIVEAIEVMRKANDEWHKAAAKEGDRRLAAESSLSEARAALSKIESIAFEHFHLYGSPRTGNIISIAREALRPRGEGEGNEKVATPDGGTESSRNAHPIEPTASAIGATPDHPAPERGGFGECGVCRGTGRRKKRPSLTYCECGCPKNKHLDFRQPDGSHGNTVHIVPCATDGCRCPGYSEVAAKSGEGREAR